MFRNIGRLFAGGLFRLIPIGVAVYVVWSAVVAAASTCRLLDSWWLNAVVNVAMWAAFICFVGWVFQFAVLQNMIDRLIKNIPIVSTVMKFIPTEDEMDMLRSGNCRECLVAVSSGCQLRGLIVREWRDKGVKWYRVYFGTSPVPFTGYALPEFREDLVKETGRKADEYFATVMSFGIK